MADDNKELQCEDLQAELSLLQKASAGLVERFLHQLVDAICKRNGPQFKDYASVWDLMEWMKVKEAWTNFIQEYVKKNSSKEEIEKELQNIQFSDEQKQKIFVCLALRKNEIQQSLIRKTAEISQSYLKNFDWKVKLIMGSDKLSNIKEPIASLDFDLVTESGPKALSIELNKDELKSVIDKLEAANKVVLQLRS